MILVARHVLDDEFMAPCVQAMPGTRLRLKFESRCARGDCPRTANVLPSPAGVKLGADRHWLNLLLNIHR